MRCQSGWSLKELLIVVGLMAALIVLLLPIGLRVRTAVRRADCRTRIATLGSWLVQEYSRTGSLPITQEEFEALARRAGIEPRCPVNGKPYYYYARFQVQFNADGTLPNDYDSPQRRHQWIHFITTLLKKYPYHPLLQCGCCYAPSLANEIERWDWDGDCCWYPVFSERVRLKDRRFLGVNFYGCVDYYNDFLLSEIINREWVFRSGYDPSKEFGGTPLPTEKIREVEQTVQQGGDSGCW